MIFLSRSSWLTWCGIEGDFGCGGLLPSSCTCRRVSPTVHTATEDSPAVRGDVRWMLRGETTVKRLAAACVGFEDLLTREEQQHTRSGSRCVFPVHCSSVSFRVSVCVSCFCGE
ncbi:hypothetical protein TcCL_ESM06115 [Trypanosoma cruzi]|nr:hypothetical protein TcCL_ESM06115 [Trypanosoma cruzi]